MGVFRGLFTRPDATRGTSPVEARKSLAGMFSRRADGSPRQGLLTPLTVAGTSGWAYSVPAASWVTSRGAVDGVVLSGNDGTVQVATDPAPATGSRIDIIYVLNRDVDNADTDSEAIVGVAVGAASGTPVAPSIPAGAMEIARATVLSTNANTSQATIQQTAPMTGLAGADIVVPFGLSSFAARIPDPVTGMKVFSTAENTLYVRVGGAWRRLWRDTGWQDMVLANGVLPNSTGERPRVRAIGDLVVMEGGISSSGFAVGGAEKIAMTFPDQMFAPRLQVMTTMGTYGRVDRHAAAFIAGNGVTVFPPSTSPLPAYWFFSGPAWAARDV